MEVKLIVHKEGLEGKLKACISMEINMETKDPEKKRLKIRIL